MKYEIGEEVVYSGFDYKKYRGQLASIKDIYTFDGSSNRDTMCIIEFKNIRDKTFYATVHGCSITNKLTNSTYSVNDFKNNNRLYMLVEDRIKTKKEYFQQMLGD